MKRVSKVVKCQRTFELIKKSLDAGYVDPENGRVCQEERGTPQGSVLSPLLSNIVLHELYKYIKNLRTKFTRGRLRSRKPKYVSIISKLRSIKDPNIRKEMLAEARKLHSTNQMDPNFRRLKYIRYADDFVVLITGPLGEAEGVRSRIQEVLDKKCGLELNMEKTQITNLQKEGFKFLGASCNKADRTKTFVVKHKRMKSVRANVRLRVNVDLNQISKKLVACKLAKWNSKHELVGTAYNSMINLSHAEIINFFNSKFRGLCNFYSFAGNRKKL